MRTFDIKYSPVSRERCQYYNVFIDGVSVCEMKYVPGYVYGFYPATKMSESVLKNAARIINSMYFNDRAIWMVDFKLKLIHE